MLVIIFFFFVNNVFSDLRNTYLWRLLFFTSDGSRVSHECLTGLQHPVFHDMSVSMILYVAVGNRETIIESLVPICYRNVTYKLSQLSAANYVQKQECYPERCSQQSLRQESIKSKEPHWMHWLWSKRALRFWMGDPKWLGENCYFDLQPHDQSVQMVDNRPSCFLEKYAISQNWHMFLRRFYTCNQFGMERFVHKVCS